MPDSTRLRVVNTLEATWPSGWRLGGSGVVPSGHPLEAMLRSFLSGQTSSLPHFSGEEVRWCTLAEDSEKLQSAIEGLRAWLLPSFGTELELQTRAGKTELGAQLLAASPL